MIVQPAGVGIPDVARGGEVWEGHVRIIHPEGLMYASRTDIGSHGRKAGRKLILDVQVPLRDVIAFRTGVRIGLTQLIGGIGWLNSRSIKERPVSWVLDGSVLKKRRCLSHQ